MKLRRKELGCCTDVNEKVWESRFDRIVRDDSCTLRNAFISIELRISTLTFSNKSRFLKLDKTWKIFFSFNIQKDKIELPVVKISYRGNS